MTVKQERLLAYALGQVPDEEALEIAHFLREHPGEASRVRDYLDCFMALVMRLEPEVLPDGAEAALLKRLHVQGAAEALLEDEEEVALEPRIATVEPAVAASSRPEGRLEPAESELIESEPVESEPVEGGPAVSAPVAAAHPEVARPDEEEAEEEVSIDPSEPPAPPPQRGRSPAWFFVLLALAALVAAVWYALPLLRPTDAPPEQAAELTSLAAFASAPGATVHPLVDTEGLRVGTLVYLPDRLFLSMELPPPGGQVYQAWEFVGGVPASLGVTEAREMLLEHDLAPGSLFGVTLEPVGGSDTPSGPPVASADL